MSFIRESLGVARDLRGFQQENKAIANQEKANAALQRYYESGQQDSGALIEGIMNAPELAGNVLKGIGIVDKQQQDQAAADVAKLWQLRQSPEQFKAAIAERVNGIMARGGDPRDTINLGMAYEQDPAQAETQMKAVAAALEARGAKTGVFEGVEVEGMTPFQMASTDLRRQELELRREEKATNTQLKVLEAQMRKESDELKRQELALKIQEQQQKLADLERSKQTTKVEKEADLEQAFFGIDNMLNTVHRVKQSPKLDSVVGTIQGRMDAYLDDESAATIRLIENLGSQAFMAMIPGLKGMGALSNAEGDKLAASLQNLSRVTGEKQFRETLAEVERLMNKSRGIIAKRYNKPESKPDVPAAQAAEPTLDDLLKQYGGGQ